MDNGQEPTVLDVMVSITSSLLRSGPNHGVTAENIDTVLAKIGQTAEKFKGPATPVNQPQALSSTPTAEAPASPAAAKSPEAPAPTPAKPVRAKAPAAAKKAPTPSVTAKAADPAPAVAKAKRGRKPKAVAAPVAETTVVPEVKQEAPAKQAVAAPTPAKRGRKPKAVAAPQVSEPAAAQATPEAPVKRGRGRPRKVRPEAEIAAQATLFASPEIEGDASENPGDPNYRFRNHMKNGKPIFFDGMKREDAINGEEVTCLVCGEHQMMLKKHLATKHGMSGEQYLRFIGVDPADPKNKDYLRGPEFGNRKSAETKVSGFGKHERPKKAVARKVKATARKATPTPATEMKKTRGRPKVTA